jgi:hypothetical protein
VQARRHTAGPQERRTSQADWVLASALRNPNLQQLKAYKLRSPRDPCAVLGEHFAVVVLVGDLVGGQWLTLHVTLEQRCSHRDKVLGHWRHWEQSLRYGTSRRADLGNGIVRIVWPCVIPALGFWRQTTFPRHRDRQ